MHKFNPEDLFLNRAKFVMKYLGVWIPPTNESLLHKLYRSLMITLQYLFLIFQIIFIIQVWGDLEAVSQAFYLLFTQACLCLKVSVFHVNVDKLRELLKQMNGEIFQPQSDRQIQILSKQASRIKALLLAFMVSSQFTCSLWAMKPLFDDVGSRKFPFDMWMPVSPEASPHYEIGYAIQVLTIGMSAYMYFGVDSVALSMLIFACAQCEIIMDKIMSVTSINYAMKNKERQKIFAENRKTLIDCVKHHEALYAFTKLSEDAYHSYLFFQISGNVGIFCMTALRLTVVEWKSVQFFSMATYLYVMMGELFVCSWSGHELTSTSEMLHTAMYDCPWYEQDVRFKRDLCFAMMRMSRPLVFRTGHYVSLSRQTFIAILRTSYSYFAVLVNQTKKED
ncbi:unnamed protein product [Chilo suppressalis]|uniref:Odorant receptor n=1 Tax=Chilo suppressalis TaxID=168631 RepID=A0ABN8B1E9_CHISP|nr:unnamed protein product [Chilo suppressalis]